MQSGVNAASVEPIFSPEVIEPNGEITPAATSATEVPAMDPVEEASMKFTTLLPYVQKLGAAMPSQKGIVRVLHAFAEFPLGATKPRLLTEGERQLFHILQELSGYKSTVITAIMKRNMEAEVMEQEVRRRTDEQLNAVAELPATAETEQTNV
jgi:hypothetical protein